MMMLCRLRISKSFTITNCVRSLRSKPIRILPVPKTTKVLSVAILGVPNVGKSVLLNHLVKARLAAASRKRHTTRAEILGVFNHRHVQLAFYDCPGFVASFDARRQEMRSLRSITETAVTGVDIVLVVVDAARTLTARDQDVFAEMVRLALEGAKEEVVLVLNKVDLVHPKTKLLDLTHQYVSLINGVKYGEENAEKAELDTTTFMISALEDDGVIDLKNYLITKAKPGRWILPEEHPLTDWTVEERVEEMVLEKLLENCHDEVPYVAAITCRSIEKMNANFVKIDVDIKVESESQKRIVIGHQGRTLVKIRQASLPNLEQIFNKKIILQLWIGLHDENRVSALG